MDDKVFLKLDMRVLNRRACPLHYWIGGEENKPLIVMMHGATMDHCMFSEQVKTLLPYYRVLVWDARGQGRSQPIGEDFSMQVCAEDLLSILQDISAEKAVLIGQSLGGYVAQTLYKIAPQMVQAMIIIGSTPISKAYSKLDVWALKASLPLFDLWPYGNFTKMVAKSTASKPDIQEYALEAIRQIDRKDFLRIWKAVSLSVDDKGDPDLIIDVPLLLVHGDNDSAGTIKRDMPVWADQEPEAEFYIIPDAAHNANQDNPEECNRLFLDFLCKHVG